MHTSESIDQVSAALSALQGEILDAPKEQQGYGYRYADLATVLQIVRPLAARHGLCVMQEAYTADTGSVSVLTRLAHSSGQWIEAGPLTMEVQPKKGLSEAQCAGMTVTYARRYALTALMGISQEDPDAAHEPEPAKQERLAARPDTRLEKLKTDIATFLELNDVPNLRASLAAIKNGEKATVWSALTPQQRSEIQSIIGDGTNA
jgi:hypothetical protein